MNFPVWTAAFLMPEQTSGMQHCCDVFKQIFCCSEPLREDEAALSGLNMPTFKTKWANGQLVSFPTRTEACTCPWCLQQMDVHCVPEATVVFWSKLLLLPFCSQQHPVASVCQFSHTVLYCKPMRSPFAGSPDAIADLGHPALFLSIPNKFSAAWAFSQQTKQHPAASACQLSRPKW